MQLTALEKPELRRLYEARLREDFPPTELRPLENMEYLMDRGAYRCYACREKEEFTAYGLFALNGEAALLDYLAVTPALRGRGLGGEFLRALKKLPLQAPFFLIEAESVESASTREEIEERERRIRFYKHCGCVETRVFSFLFGVEYQILVLPRSETLPANDEVQASLEGLYRMMITPLLEKRPVAYESVCRVFQRQKPPSARQDFYRELGRSVTFLQRSRKRFMGERLRKYGFTGAMYTILLHVSRHPGATQDSISNHMYLDKSNVARRTKRLVELGYLRREPSPTDQRQNNLYLTEKGRELVPILLKNLAEWGEATAAALTEEERATLIALLSKCHGGAEPAPGGVPPQARRVESGEKE